MKNFLLLLFCAFSFNALASDVITLTNGQSFEGTITKVNNCSLNFSIDDNVYTIPASDIVYAEFEKISKRRANKITHMLGNEDNCFAGTTDGAMHGHKAGQFCAGFFGGLIGFVIVAVVDRTPTKSKNIMLISENREMWNDLTYLTCYQQQSKKEAIKAAGAGFGAWVLLVLLSY
jgi:hypothetical protein